MISSRQVFSLDFVSQLVSDVQVEDGFFVPVDKLLVYP